MKQVRDAIPLLLQLVGAVTVSHGLVAAMGYVLTIPAVQDFLFGTALPFLGFAGLMFLWVQYGKYLVRVEDREREKERSTRRRIADAESRERQEAYFHAKGLCLNCNPKLSGRNLERLQQCARSDAELTHSRFPSMA